VNGLGCVKPTRTATSLELAGSCGAPQVPPAELFAPEEDAIV
jgi:hypothetical protein